MRIKLDSQVVKKITFYGKPKSKLYPVDKIPASEKKLEGFTLHTSRKPNIALFEERERKVAQEKEIAVIIEPKEEENKIDLKKEE